MTQQIVVAALYKFVTLEDYVALRAAVADLELDPVRRDRRLLEPQRGHDPGA